MQTVVPSTQQEFVGDELRVLVQKKQMCQVEFQVYPSSNLIASARAESVKAVAREAEIAGFRKGKAPEAMVVKQCRSAIDKQFSKTLGDLAFVEAQKLVKIPVLNQNSKISFSVKELDGGALELLFSFETEPTIPELHLDRFVPKPVDKKQVGEKELDEAIRQMTFFYAQWTNVEHRSVREGDFIVIDLDTVDGEKVQRVFNQIRFEVVSSRMANWMRKLVLNAKVGDVLEGLSEPDDDATEEEKREFQPKTVRLYLRKVEEPLLPVVDDAFAQKVGAANLEGMREMVKGILVSQVEGQAEEERREQVNRFLVSQYTFDLPRSLLEAEYHHRFTETQKNPELQQSYAKMTEEQRKEVLQKIFQEAERSLRLFYLAKQIIHNEKIPVTHQEVNDRAIAQRKSHAMGLPAEGEISKQEYALALSLVFLSKVQDFVLGKTSGEAAST